MKIREIKNIFPTSTAARFNLAVWQKHGKDSLFFIGREITQIGKLGHPDMGILKLFEVGPEGNLLQEKIIWKPLYDGINLEDPRVLELHDESLIIGLTALVRNNDDVHIPYPAIVKIDSLRLWKEQLPPFLVINSFGAGKNLTPIDASTYFFRPDAQEYYHKLLVFSLHSQIAEKICDISFPTDLSWASWRIGTTIPPIWLTPNEALFIIHGVRMEMINNIPTYIYSIGKAKLVRKGNAFEVFVGKDPIITPDDFLDANGTPLVEELHPEEKKVVYSCGGVIKKDTPDILSLYVNVGDRATFEVELPLKELTKDLF